ncbi:MAG: response regulator transcription factor [Fibrobacteres bacterium]|nr:response regulator transcription factor [Fibrobacterota bacterium]
MKILVVEDEKKVAAFIRRGLIEQSYSVDMAHDGMEGERLARGSTYDAIILDLMLPRKSGFALCRAIRTFDVRVPILILTALDSTEDKLQGLEAGADEYLPKPFEFRELLAHLRSLMRRRENLPSSGLLRLADLQMDLITRKVSRGGQNLALTAREFALLEYFLRNHGRVITRTEIAQKVWETSFDSESNVIDVYVSFLRKKIDKGFPEKLIHTLVGVGYVLRTGEPA